MADDDRTLQESQELLDEMLQDVQEWRGTLAGGEAQPLGAGGAALLALKETDVRFGHPGNRLARLTPDLFAALNVALDPIQAQQLQGDKEFYYLTLTVSLFPKRGAQFQLVECRLEFPQENAIIQTIFPEARWRKVFEWGGSAHLGLNGKLEWEVGVPGNKVRELTGAGALPEANLKTENEMSSYIAVPGYSFDIGRPEITATGVGDTQASWRLQNPDLQEGKTVEFVLVFKVPAGTEEVELAGRVLAEPKMAWLTAQIADVFDELSSRLKAIFSKRDEEREGAERLPVGAYEKWTLKLPRGKEGDPVA